MKLVGPIMLYDNGASFSFIHATSSSQFIHWLLPSYLFPVAIFMYKYIVFHIIWGKSKKQHWRSFLYTFFIFFKPSQKLDKIVSSSPISDWTDYFTRFCFSGQNDVTEPIVGLVHGFSGRIDRAIEIFETLVATLYVYVNIKVIPTILNLWSKPNT